MHRRELLVGTAVLAATPASAWASPSRARLRPLPLVRVRLLPSIWTRAREANLAYLHALEPDRLLNRFRASAGLEPKGERYDGWEGDTIAGHTLGHYLTAIALMHAATGDTECRRRAAYIVGELAACQQAHGDGYVAGFTRKKDGREEDGKVIFAEIAEGDIRSLGFDLNGCWVPFYNWHKTFTGLFAAQDHCDVAAALPVAIGLGTFIAEVFDKLDEAQMQTVLDCEHGGINESFAELYARTGNPRWLRLAERLRHRKVLDPLAQGQDVLPWIHANTQIPKLIGLARLHELTGKPGDAAAPRFFWDTVVRDYSYVIGGNADREYFPAPRTISKHITEQTCESCNTYNMLKLTQHLYAWQPEARLFDYFERAHLNHIMAHQDPATGAFAYMVPLMSGSARSWSKPFDHFWCCVGTGMESHAKHGEAAWWTGSDTIVANLYMPSVARWDEHKAVLRMETAYPFDQTVELVVEAADANPFTVALRIPSWCKSPALALNGKPMPLAAEDGYARLQRRWQAGDRLTLTLPMALRTEPTPDDPTTVALLYGPVVLAADLGPAEAPFEGLAPALVGTDLVSKMVPVDTSQARFRTEGIGRPNDLAFVPFFSQTGRRTAVYFRAFDDTSWQAEQARFAAEQAADRALAARTVDLIQLGEMQPERDHQLEAAVSYPVTYRGRHGRDARGGGYFSFVSAVKAGPLTLRATYWGEERNKRFDILIDGEKIATQVLDGDRPGDFFDIDYVIPERLTRGRDRVTIRFQPSDERTRCGPVFGVRILQTPTA